jgi:hypothetical protein
MSLRGQWLARPYFFVVSLHRTANAGVKTLPEAIPWYQEIASSLRSSQ